MGNIISRVILMVVIFCLPSYAALNLSVPIHFGYSSMKMSQSDINNAAALYGGKTEFTQVKEAFSTGTEVNIEFTNNTLLMLGYTNISSKQAVSKWDSAVTPKKYISYNISVFVDILSVGVGTTIINITAKDKLLLIPYLSYALPSGTLNIESSKPRLEMQNNLGGSIEARYIRSLDSNVLNMIVLGGYRSLKLIGDIPINLTGPYVSIGLLVRF